MEADGGSFLSGRLGVYCELLKRNFTDRDLYWTHGLFKRRLKFCRGSSTAQGKDIKVKVLLPFFSHSSLLLSLHHKDEKTAAEVKEKQTELRGTFMEMNIQHELRLAKKQALSPLAAQWHIGLFS